MKIILIRHGKTKGGTEKRYIGKTDEPLCDAGLEEIKKRCYPDCDLVITSEKIRCIETANIIFPNKKIIICGEFNELDFGDFEGGNYVELRDDPNYVRWLESGGTIAFPNGEEPRGFKQRCVRGFRKITSEFSDRDKLAFVIHGGTIMSIMEEFAIPKRNFYYYQVGHCEGFLCEFDGNYFVKTEKL